MRNKKSIMSKLLGLKVAEIEKIREEAAEMVDRRIRKSEAKPGGSPPSEHLTKEEMLFGRGNKPGNSPERPKPLENITASVRKKHVLSQKKKAHKKQS